MSSRKSAPLFETAKKLLTDARFQPFKITTEDDEEYTIEKPSHVLLAEDAVYVGVPGPSPAVMKKVVTLDWQQVASVAPLEMEPTISPVTSGKSGRKVELFTDGACEGNPGPGGWAYILRDPEMPGESRDSGGERRTTNNRMELTSVIRGLEAVAGSAEVDVTTDSQYVAKGVNEWMAGWKKRGWKRQAKGKLEPVANEDLWRRLDELMQVHRVKCHWVRGHVGHPENEECDRMAVEAIRNL